MNASQSRPAEVRVQPATTDDIGSWLEIVREVEPAFGPMPDFETTLARKIDQGNALCVRRAGEGQAVIDGGVLVGGVGSDRWIRWLAVRAGARRLGIGKALVVAAIDRCGLNATVSLDTFGADSAFGCPARTLYSQLGFEAGDMVGAGPEGGTRQRFVRAATGPTR